jgi:eukaryotic-like serine/threonine-protein kinase
MATVWLAEDVRHRRRVALKVLYPELSAAAGARAAAPRRGRAADRAADALQYALEHRIIHRDIKPENIHLQGGHALVADFGIALAVQHAGGARMTQTGLSLGTPQYMAPEQAVGEKEIDARADVYALGAVTYEMLVGAPPSARGSATWGSSTSRPAPSTA